jgi:hypothetical protein
VAVDVADDEVLQAAAERALVNGHAVDASQRC